MRRGVWVLLAACLALLLGLGCPFSPDRGDGNGGGDVNRESRDNLLTFLAYAYVEKDLDKYDEALDERFRFYFLEQDFDAAQLPPGQTWWGKTEDTQSTTNMFNAPDVIEIKMSFLKETQWYYCPKEHQGDVIDASCCRLNPTIEVTTEVAGEEPLTRIVNRSYLDIAVVPDSETPGLWRVFSIQEILKP